MAMLFGICAIVGTTVLVCQFVLSIMGFAGESFDGDTVDVAHDAAGDHSLSTDDGHHSDHGSSWFFGVISLKTMTAAIAFFGLTGLALESMEMPVRSTLGGAILAGVGAMYLVHWMMRSMAMLRADGTVRIREAVGVVGTVYLPIPGRNSGLGKVTLNLQSQSIELQARTTEDTLATGTRVVVTRVIDTDLVEVVAVQKIAA
ncbi:MAG: NfeD family protein [Planctomycetaceae bacterium]|nr:NfeD family protein [Planctomycetaceae bacterium]